MAHPPGYPQGPQGPSPYPPAAPGPGAPRPAGAPPVKRKGTSKAVPIVVSMALAGGTFAGLTLGLGTGKSDAAEQTKAKPEPKPEPRPEPRPEPKPEPRPEPVVAAPDAGAAPQPAVEKATLTIQVEPENAKVTVDGVAVTGSIELELTDGKKTVRVVAKASGHHSYDEQVDVEGNETVAIKLRKRRGGGGGSGTGSGSGTSGGGGIIDL